jgi:hypothetical protein
MITRILLIDDDPAGLMALSSVRGLSSGSEMWL